MVVDEDKPMTDAGSIRILGYFALSVQNITIPEGLSKSKVQKLDGINKNAKSVICHLIGQLGKNDKYSQDLEVKVLLNHALEALDEARSIIGRNVALVECEDKEKVLKFYKDNNFEKIGKNEDQTLIRLVRMLK